MFFYKLSSILPLSCEVRDPYEEIYACISAASVKYLISALRHPGRDFSGDPGIQDPTESLNLTENLSGTSKSYSAWLDLLKFELTICRFFLWMMVIYCEKKKLNNKQTNAVLIIIDNKCFFRGKFYKSRRFPWSQNEIPPWLIVSTTLQVHIVVEHPGW